MKYLFSLDQHPKFPERIYGIIVGEKGLSALPFYNINGDSYVIFLKRNTYAPFYTAILPRTYEVDHIVHSFVYTNHKLPNFAKIELIPKFYIKLLYNVVYNIIVATPANEEVSLTKDGVKKDILSLFDIPAEGLIIESEYKAKAFLIHANKLFERKFIIVRD